jgi:hypothetical protein
MPKLTKYANRQQQLLAFTTDPDFAKGLEAGQMCYQEVYGEALPPNEDVLEGIKDNLSDAALAEQYASPYVVKKRFKVSYAYHLGFLISWLDTYTAAKERKGRTSQEPKELHSL